MGQGQPVAQGTGAAAPVRPRKRGHSRVSAAVPGRRAQCRLLCAVASIPCQLYFPDFRFEPPRLTESSL